MIDISNKKITKRLAIAKAVILIKKEIIQKIKNNKIPKGDVLNTAKIAGILAAKNTPNLIPLCHPVKLTFINIDYKLNQQSIEINCTVKGEDKTGFEMEALVGVNIAALTIYDMCKMFDKEIVITNVELIKKTGGKSGIYLRREKK